MWRMTRGLERRYGLGHHHFVTFSCYGRQPFLAEAWVRDVFEASLEAMRRKYGFTIDSYVVMPEHVHLLVSEPRNATLSVALQALKISVSRRSVPRPFWQPRFYDFNVYTEKKRLEKRRYASQSCGAGIGDPSQRLGLVQLSPLGHGVRWRGGDRITLDVCTEDHDDRGDGVDPGHPANPHLEKTEMWGTRTRVGGG